MKVSLICVVNISSIQSNLYGWKGAKTCPNINENCPKMTQFRENSHLW